MQWIEENDTSKVILSDKVEGIKTLKRIIRCYWWIIRGVFRSRCLSEDHKGYRWSWLDTNYYVCQKCGYFWNEPRGSRRIKM